MCLQIRLVERNQQRSRPCHQCAPNKGCAGHCLVHTMHNARVYGMNSKGVEVTFSMLVQLYRVQKFYSSNFFVPGTIVKISVPGTIVPAC